MKRGYAGKRREYSYSLTNDYANRRGFCNEHVLGTQPERGKALRLMV
jgi:hypothetical protein